MSLNPRNTGNYVGYYFLWSDFDPNLTPYQWISKNLKYLGAGIKPAPKFFVEFDV